MVMVVVMVRGQEGCRDGFAGHGDHYNDERRTLSINSTTVCTLTVPVPSLDEGGGRC